MSELLIVSLLIMGVGLVGTVVPGLPGMPLVLGGILLFAIGTELRVIGPLQLAAFVILGVIGIGLNLLGHVLGARRFGASGWGLLGALVGLVLGLLVAGPFGLIFGPFMGVVAFEVMRGREMSAAIRSGFGTVVGYLFGALAEVAIALGMIGWFLWSTWGVLIGTRS